MAIEGDRNDKYLLVLLLWLLVLVTLLLFLFQIKRLGVVSLVDSLPHTIGLLLWPFLLVALWQRLWRATLDERFGLAIVAWAAMPFVALFLHVFRRDFVLSWPIAYPYLPMTYPNLVTVFMAFLGAGMDIEKGWRQ